MEQFKAPSPLSLTGNPADNWHSWEQSFRWYIAASGEKEEQVKIDILLHTIGEDALKVYNTLTVRAEGDELTMEDVFQAFKDYCSAQKNVEPYQYWSHQMTAEHLHIKEEPEMFSEGQEENQLCVQQETNSAACPVKCEDEEEKPQSSQLHWRQLTEITMKEEPSTCTLDKFMKRQHVGINSKGPLASQNPDPSSLVLQGPDGTETDSPQAEDSEDDDDDDDDEDSWQKPLSESDTEADFDSTRKNRKMSDLSKHAKIGCKSSKEQICSKKQVQVKMTSEYVGVKKSSLSVASELRTHNGKKSFQCDVCSKCFFQTSNLKQHMRIHTGEKPFKCDVCSKCFTTKSHHKEHMTIHTGEKPLQCDVCRQCFNYMSQLKRHMIFHTGEKPFKCDVCCKCFITTSQLKEHMRIHTGEKPFKCNVCSESFIRKENLQIHIRTHTGEKPFECNVCRKCFNTTSLLKRHMRIHTGEKPFKCDACSKCFITTSQLKEHIRIHTGEKPFTCDVCRKCFYKKFNLKVHMKIHTGEKVCH